MLKKDVYSPHIRSAVTTTSIMGDVCIALVPALIGAIGFFGLNALFITLVSVVTAVACEALWQFLHKEKITVKDLSAVVTGMLLAFNLSSSTPLWLVAMASAFSIIVVKQIFGGIGNNVLNPALMGRLFLMLLYPSKIITYVEPLKTDATSSATILAAVKAGSETGYSLLDAFLGKVPGALGETSVLLLLIGFAYLAFKKEVNLAVTGSFFATVFVLMLIFGQDPFMQLCSGGLVLGGCFMLTDYNLSSGHGKWLYGIAAGIIVVIIRLWGHYPEGVCYAILIVNCMSALIDKLDRKSHTYGID